MQSRVEDQLRSKGLLSPGQKLEPYMVPDGHGGMTQASGGTRNVFQFPGQPGKLIKIYKDGFTPEQITSFTQRDAGLESYLSVLEHHGVTVVHNDYSLAQYGMVIQTELPPGGKSVKQFLADMKAAGNRNKDFLEFNAAYDDLQQHLMSGRDDMAEVMGDRFDLHFTKGRGDQMEKVPIDLGRIEQTEDRAKNVLNNCKVYDGTPPRIVCFDW